MAADGDAVLVRPGEYVIPEPIDFNRLWRSGHPQGVPAKDIVVMAEAGPEATTIRMSDAPLHPGKASVVIFKSGETAASLLEGFRLTGGTGTSLGGAYEPGGGGLLSKGSSPTLRNLRIDGNEASYGGGALFEGSSAIVSGCAFSGNSATTTGGGVFCSEGCLTLIDCTISGNSASGLTCFESSPVLINCVISENSAYYGSAGGFRCDSASAPSLIRCTICGNLNGGISCSRGSALSLTSSIVWGNELTSIAAEPDSVPLVRYSCIAGETVWRGQGNINADPLFCGWGDRAEVSVVSAGGADDPPTRLEQAVDFSFALAAASPCIGSGEGGANMGASAGRCDLPGVPGRHILLSPGRFSLAGRNLYLRASIAGSGEAETSIAGDALGLRTGSELSGLTLKGYVYVGRGESPTLNCCAITGHQYYSGVYCPEGSAPVVTGCTISGSEPGVWCERSSPTFVDCAITRNGMTANFCGGGFQLDESFATLIGCRISRNYSLAQWPGGAGIQADGGATRLVDCEIFENVAWPGAALEGDNITLVGCKIFGNMAGAAFLLGSSAMVNCAVWGNAGYNLYSGGILIGVRRATSATLTNCTISGNRCNGYADDAAVVLSRYVGAKFSVELSISNCIIWGNIGPSLRLYGDPKCDVSFSAIEGDPVCQGGQNVLEDPRFVSAGAYDHARVDAQGYPDFIVEAPDLRLQPGSPCIDTGSIEAPSVDIDGKGRGCEGGVDMGAYESGGCPAANALFLRGDVNGSGTVDISDPIFLLNFLFYGGKAPGCLDAGDANDDGRLDTSDAIYSLNFKFLGGPAPKMPFPGCGTDLWVDVLDCELHPPCGQAMRDGWHRP